MRLENEALDENTGDVK